jgi:hypothetical protein
MRSEDVRREAVCTVPVSIPVFEHSVLASREEVVGVGLEAHTGHTVFVRYERS